MPNPIANAIINSNYHIPSKQSNYPAVDITFLYAPSNQDVLEPTKVILNNVYDKFMATYIEKMKLCVNTQNTLQVSIYLASNPHKHLGPCSHKPRIAYTHCVEFQVHIHTYIISQWKNLLPSFHVFGIGHEFEHALRMKALMIQHPILDTLKIITEGSAEYIAYPKGHYDRIKNLKSVILNSNRITLKKLTNLNYVKSDTYYARAHLVMWFFLEEKTKAFTPILQLLQTNQTSPQAKDLLDQLAVTEEPAFQKWLNHLFSTNVTQKAAQTSPNILNENNSNITQTNLGAPHSIGSPLRKALTEHNLKEIPRAITNIRTRIDQWNPDQINKITYVISQKHKNYPGIAFTLSYYQLNETQINAIHNQLNVVYDKFITDYIEKMNLSAELRKDTFAKAKIFIWNTRTQINNCSYPQCANQGKAHAHRQYPKTETDYISIAHVYLEILGGKECIYGLSHEVGHILHHILCYKKSNALSIEKAKLTFKKNPNHLFLKRLIAEGCAEQVAHTHHCHHTRAILQAIPPKINIDLKSIAEISEHFLSHTMQNRVGYTHTLGHLLLSYLIETAHSTVGPLIFAGEIDNSLAIKNSLQVLAKTDQSQFTRWIEMLKKQQYIDCPIQYSQEEKLEATTYFLNHLNPFQIKDKKPPLAITEKTPVKYTSPAFIRKK